MSDRNKFTLDERLSGAFVEGETFESRFFGNGAIQVNTVAQLQVSSGRIVACDPLVFFDSKPFTQAVPNGVFPVDLSTTRFEHEGGVSHPILFARVRFEDTAPVRWELAVTLGQDPTTLGPNEYFGYPVDTGTGSFMDAEAAKGILKIFEDEVWSRNYEISERLLEKMRATNAQPGWQWAETSLDEVPGNLIVFTSGIGDGYYPSYFGFDKDGRVVQLITDFRL